jgi:hypothetical protein
MVTNCLVTIIEKAETSYAQFPMEGAEPTRILFLYKSCKFQILYFGDNHKRQVLERSGHWWPPNRHAVVFYDSYIVSGIGFAQKTTAREYYTILNLLVFVIPALIYKFISKFSIFCLYSKSFVSRCSQSNR